MSPLRAPDTSCEWAVKVLTIAVVLVMAAAFVVFGEVNTLRSDLRDIRSDQVRNAEIRRAFEAQDRARDCLQLTKLELSKSVLKELGC